MADVLIQTRPKPSSLSSDVALKETLVNEGDRPILDPIEQIKKMIIELSMEVSRIHTEHREQFCYLQNEIKDKFCYLQKKLEEVQEHKIEQKDKLSDMEAKVQGFNRSARDNSRGNVATTLSTQDNLAMAYTDDSESEDHNNDGVDDAYDNSHIKGFQRSNANALEVTERLGRQENIVSAQSRRRNLNNKEGCRESEENCNNGTENDNQTPQCHVECCVMGKYNALHINIGGVPDTSRGNYLLNLKVHIRDKRLTKTKVRAIEEHVLKAISDNDNQDTKEIIQQIVAIVEESMECQLINVKHGCIALVIVTKDKTYCANLFNKNKTAIREGIKRCLFALIKQVTRSNMEFDHFNIHLKLEDSEEENQENKRRRSSTAMGPSKPDNPKIDSDNGFEDSDDQDDDDDDDDDENGAATTGDTNNKVDNQNLACSPLSEPVQSEQISLNGELRNSPKDGTIGLEEHKRKSKQIPSTMSREDDKTGDGVKDIVQLPGLQPACPSRPSKEPSIVDPDGHNHGKRENIVLPDVNRMVIEPVQTELRSVSGEIRDSPEEGITVLEEQERKSDQIPREITEQIRGPLPPAEGDGAVFRYILSTPAIRPLKSKETSFVEPDEHIHEEEILNAESSEQAEDNLKQPLRGTTPWEDDKTEVVGKDIAWLPELQPACPSNPIMELSKVDPDVQNHRKRGNRMGIGVLSAKDDPPKYAWEHKSVKGKKRDSSKEVGIGSEKHDRKSEHIREDYIPKIIRDVIIKKWQQESLFSSKYTKTDAKDKLPTSMIENIYEATRYYKEHQNFQSFAAELSLARDEYPNKNANFKKINTNHAHNSPVHANPLITAIKHDHKAAIDADSMSFNGLAIKYQRSAVDSDGHSEDLFDLADLEDLTSSDLGYQRKIKEKERTYWEDKLFCKLILSVICIAIDFLLMDSNHHNN